MASHHLGLAIAATALVVGALPALLGTAERPRIEVPVAAPLPEPPPVGANLVVAEAPAEPAPVAAPAAAASAGTMQFPDGSSRPALNGATQALEVPWPAARPWSPIVETVHHGGTDWYRHADGTFTTTIVRIEEVSGKELQIPLCCTPRPSPVRTHLRQ